MGDSLLSISMQPLAKREEVAYKPVWRWASDGVERIGIGALDPETNPQMVCPANQFAISLAAGINKLPIPALTTPTGGRKLPLKVEPKAVKADIVIHFFLHFSLLLLLLSPSITPFLSITLVFLFFLLFFNVFLIPSVHCSVLIITYSPN